VRVRVRVRVGVIVSDEVRVKVRVRCLNRGSSPTLSLPLLVFFLRWDKDERHIKIYMKEELEKEFENKIARDLRNGGMS
jgi:hypothetical protein